MKTYQPLSYRNGAEILKGPYEKEGQTKNPIIGSNVKEKRYIAGIANGLFYILGGLFAGSIVMLFSLLPKELVAALAGLALLGAIATNITTAIKEESHRDSALITFIATVSGMSFLGLSPVFWGTCIGLIAHVILTKREAAVKATEQLQTAKN